VLTTERTKAPAGQGRSEVVAPPLEGLTGVQRHRRRRCAP